MHQWRRYDGWLIVWDILESFHTDREATETKSYPAEPSKILSTADNDTRVPKNSQPYFQSYQAPTSAYSPYPTPTPQMQAPSVQYSSAYSTTTYTSLAPYDRFSATSSYPFSTPGAILPHSAINLSVKTEEASGQSAELSPQILDLTRPIRYRRMLCNLVGE